MPNEWDPPEHTTIKNADINCIFINFKFYKSNNRCFWKNEAKITTKKIQI